jgi:hypothetical protein
VAYPHPSPLIPQHGALGCAASPCQREREPCSPSPRRRGAMGPWGIQGLHGRHDYRGPMVGGIGVRSPGRLDVLVEPEEVGRIVPVLERHETIVDRAVRRPDAVGALLAWFQVVDVDAAGGVRLDRLPDIACPLDVLVGLGGVRPARDDQEVVVPVPVGERRLLGADAAVGAAELLQHQRRER